MNKAELEQHYLNTTYSVFINDIQYDCKIGEVTPAAINKLLAKEQSAAILTAWNPRSLPLSSNENDKRNSELQSYLQQHGYSILKAVGRGNDDNWPGEESYLILNIRKQEAEKLAFKFQQNAYVWIEEDKPVILNFSRTWFD